MHLYDLKIKSALIFCIAIQSSLKVTYNFNITHMYVTLIVKVVISCSIRSQAPNYTPDNTLEPPFRGFVQFSPQYNKPKVDFTLIISLYNETNEERLKELLIGIQEKVELTKRKALHGIIDEVRVYDRALSSEEIYKIFEE